MRDILSDDYGQLLCKLIFENGEKWNFKTESKHIFIKSR